MGLVSVEEKHRFMVSCVSWVRVEVGGGMPCILGSSKPPLLTDRLTPLIWMFAAGGLPWTVVQAVHVMPGAGWGGLFLRAPRFTIEMLTVRPWKCPHCLPNTHIYTLVPVCNLEPPRTSNRPSRVGNFTWSQRTNDGGCCLSLKWQHVFPPTVEL